METEAELLESISSYVNQVAQIRQHLADPSVSREDLSQIQQLESDLCELIQVTRDQLESVQKCNELSVTSTSRDPTDDDVIEIEDDEIAIDNEQNLTKIVDQLVGMRCKVPYTGQLGPSCPLQYHNAVIMDAHSDTQSHAMHVVVLYCNPITNAMKPCKYFLDSNCNFGEKCKYSHGETVPLDSVLEYVDPDFSGLQVDGLCLVKDGTDLWGLGRVTSLNAQDSLAAVEVFQSGQEKAVNYEHLWPLDQAVDASKNVVEEAGESSAYVPPKYSNAESSGRVVGTWEQHTRGIGSKLMLAMGYKYGHGLGKSGDGISDPIPVKVLPKGKSLDHIMDQKGGKGEKFLSDKVIRKQKRKENLMKKKLQKDYLRNSTEAGIFDFLNKKLGKSERKAKTSAEKIAAIKKDTCESLKIQAFKLEEERKKIVKSSKGYEETLKRHGNQDEKLFEIVSGKLLGVKQRLEQIKLKEMRIRKELDERSNLRKSTIF